MAIQQTTSSGKVEISPAREAQEPVLANLLELYTHDFSDFMDLKPGPDGRFGYKSLSLYWKEPGRYPFLIIVDGHPAGLVFVRRGSAISDDPAVWDMAEFFVVRGCRRLGIGTAVAHEIWDKFPGRWQVRVMGRNQQALQFWARAIGEFLGEDIASVHLEKNGAGWQVFSLESKRGASQSH